MKYGDRLAQLRKDRDMLQSDLAAILDVSPSAIGSYERSERQPNYELLTKYSKLFNVSIDYLLCNSDEKFTLEQYKQLSTFDLKDMLDKHEITLDGKPLAADLKAKLADIAHILCFDRLK